MQSYKTFHELQSFPRKLTQHLETKTFRNLDKFVPKHTPFSTPQKDNTLKPQRQHVESAISTR